MTVQNDFLVWDAAGTNLESQAGYAADSARLNGVGSGIASSSIENKSKRQASLIATMIASFIVQQTGQTAIDDGTITTLLANFTQAATTGQFLGVQKFTTSGTYTPTAGMKLVIFEVQGGGAGGGGSTGAAAGNVSLGAPGTSGSYAKGLFTAATIGASQVVTIGGGSNGGAGIAATNGGTSSVGSLITAPGGIGGGTLTNQVPPTVNGNGTSSSAATGGNIVSSVGGVSGSTVGLTSAIAVTGTGGASIFGVGAPGISINANGVGATNYGTGGGGTAVNSSGGTATGGNGAAGIVIAWEYS